MSLNLDEQYKVSLTGTDIAEVPSEYIQVEYIESSGTQYIDTGHACSSNTKFVLDIATSNSATTFQVMTSATPSSYTGFILINESDTHELKFRSYASTLTSTGIILDENKHSFELGYGYLIYDGTKYTGSTDFTGTLGNAIIFRRELSGSYGYAYAKLYSYKLYESDTLVFDLIPAIRKSDSVAGMYDTVTSTFFTNSGTGTFTAGAPVQQRSIKLNDSLIWRATDRLKEVDGQSVQEKSVPDGYTQVAYTQNVSGTESTGGAGSSGNVGSYINTGINPIPGAKVVMKFRYTADTNCYRCMFGGYDSNTKNYGIVFTQTAIYIMYGGQASVTASHSFVNGTWYEITFDTINKQLTVEGNGYTDTYSFSSLSLPSQSSLSIYLFTDNAVGSISTYNTTYTLKGDIEYFEYYSDGESLTNRLIPAIRTSDSAIGMYDTVTFTFFTNSGTGTFTAGPEVPCPDAPIDIQSVGEAENLNGIPEEYDELEYIQSSGTQYIDSGYQMYYTDSSTENVSKTVIEFEANWYETSGSDYQGYGIGSGHKVLPYMGPDFATQSTRHWTIGSTVDFHVAVSSESEFYGSKHYLKFDGPNATATFDTTSGSITLDQLSGGYSNFYLFGYCSGSTGATTANPNHSRCYYFRIWNDNTLTCNFIPARRKSDSVVGMYDTVTQIFFTNAGSGDFTAGPVAKRYKITAVAQKIPDASYTQLAYLKGDATAYIDTGYLPTSSDSIEVKYNAYGSTGYCIFGTYSGGNYYFLQSGTTTTANARFGTVQYDSIAVTKTDVWHVFKMTSSGGTGTEYLDGNLIGTTSLGNPTGKVFLFSRNTGSEANYTWSGKIAYYKVWNGGTLIHYYIPAKASDGTLGMVDIADNNTFYTNAADSGDFTAGPEIKKTYHTYLTAPLRKVGDYADTISVRRSKNLFDGNWYLVAQKILKSTAPITLPVSIYRAWQGPGFIIPVEYGKTYTVSLSSFSGLYGSGGMMWFNEYSQKPAYDTTENFIQQTAINSITDLGNKITYSIKNKNCTYLLVSFASYQDTMPFNVNIVDCMIEEGSTASDYEPYGWINTVTRNVGNESLAGKTWTKETTPTIRYYCVDNDILAANSRTLPMYCNMFINVHDGKAIADCPNNSFYQGYASSTTYLYIHTADYSTTSELSAALIDAYMVFPLATPTTETITWYNDAGEEDIPRYHDGDTLTWTTTVQPSKSLFI